MVKDGKRIVAALINERSNIALMALGDSTDAPQEEQTGLQGASLAEASVTLERNGTIVSATASFNLLPDVTFSEAALFTTDGTCFDRWLLGPFKTTTEGVVEIEWSQETL